MKLKIIALASLVALQLQGAQSEPRQQAENLAQELDEVFGSYARRRARVLPNGSLEHAQEVQAMLAFNGVLKELMPDFQWYAHTETAGISAVKEGIFLETNGTRHLTFWTPFSGFSFMKNRGWENFDCGKLGIFFLSFEWDEVKSISLKNKKNTLYKILRIKDIRVPDIVLNTGTSGEWYRDVKEIETPERRIGSLNHYE